MLWIWADLLNANSEPPIKRTRYAEEGWTKAWKGQSRLIEGRWKFHGEACPICRMKERNCPWLNSAEWGHRQYKYCDMTEKVKAKYKWRCSTYSSVSPAILVNVVGMITATFNITLAFTLSIMSVLSQILPYSAASIFLFYASKSCVVCFGGLGWLGDRTATTS